MIGANVFARMTPEQKRYISLQGVKAKELKRLAQEPGIYRPIPEGLQLAAFFLDFRCDEPRANHVFLFEAGYAKRYEWMMNNNQKDGLIGWHDAVRHGASHIRSLIREE